MSSASPSVSAFTGHIAGVGTTSGTRVVVGLWDVTPLGPVADAMVEDPDGHRTLVAPTAELAEFVAATYVFDEVVVEPVQRDGWSLVSPSLSISLVPGRRRAVGALLRAVPAPLRRSVTWARLTDPVARVAMPGVRTVGTAGGGRTEWYAARDAWLVDAVSATWRGTDLGTLAPVEPAVRFGFGSAPRTPTLTSLTSYVRA